MNNDRYALLDARGLMLHSYHSGKDAEAEMTAEGEVLNPPGFTVDTLLDRYIHPLLAQGWRPTQLIAVWEGREGNAYRKRMYPQYKEGRKAGSAQMREHLKEAQEHVSRFLGNLGLLQVNAPGVEADDLIAWLTTKLPVTLVVTVDKDLTALASPTVQVRVKDEAHGGGAEGLTGKDRISIPFKHGETTVSVPPEHVTLYKSLVGDSSDSYGGVKGFGPKAWEKLCADFGDEGLALLKRGVEKGDMTLVTNRAVAEPDNSYLRLILDQAGAWYTSYNLARLWPEIIHTYDNVLGQFRAPQWGKKVPSHEEMAKHLKESGASYLLQRLGHLFPSPQLVSPSLWTQEEFLETFKSEVAKSSFITFDLETWAPETPAFETAKAKGSSFVDVHQSKIAGASFAFGKYLEDVVYIPFDHKGEENWDKQFLTDLLTSIPPEVPLVVQNASFEYTVCLNDLGVSLEPLRDTAVLASYADENQSMGLKDLSKHYLGYTQMKYNEVVPEGMTMRDLTAGEVLSYGADDALVTAHLYALLSVICRTEGTFDFCNKEEMDAALVSAEAYIEGCGLDVEECLRQEKEDREGRDKATARVHELLSSPEATEFMGNVDVTPLYEDRLALALSKARRKDTFPEIVDAERDLAVQTKVEEDLMAAVTYTPPTVTTSEVKFTATLGQLNTLIDLLNTPEPGRNLPVHPLPKLEKKTAAAITSYLVECEEAQRAGAGWTLGQDSFLKALGPSSGKNGEIGPLLDLYTSLLTQHGKVKQQLSGSHFNFGSPKQMQELFYGMLGLPIRMRTLEVSDERKEAGLTEGSPQANKDAVAMALAMDLPEGDWRREVMLSVRGIQEMSTRIEDFYSKYPSWVYPDGLIRPGIRSIGTETRRPSGSNPNALQWPKRGDGKKFRRCIVPNKNKGHDIIVSIDWNQEELRLAAGLSGDLALTSCYIGKDVADLVPESALGVYGRGQVDAWLLEETKDAHSLTGAKLACDALKRAVTYEEFEEGRKGLGHSDTKLFNKLRRDAKDVNFGSSYNIGPVKLARKLLCHPDVAKEYLDAKKALYWGYEAWRARVIDFARSHGFVETLLGARRHVGAEIHSEDDKVRGHCERSLVNFMIQGLAAEILKKTLSSLREDGVIERAGATFIVPLYDELVFSCHSSQAVPLILEVHDRMVREVPGLPIPLLAEPSLGVNFGDQVEIGPFPTKEGIEEALEIAFNGGKA
jgi:DNA polymerase I-like protein with 3'-5' exonuclease and polymerase domains/5'-3' exonuclease